MKLIKCYIENFGKLHNINKEFENGLNTIKEDNGYGKTTFATFIKSMFYGLDDGKKSKENSERKKYMPWQGGNYGGNIEFELNNKKYKIERFFGKKPTEDSFVLYDLATNLESKEYSDNIGEEIFKINKSAYERSTYIPQGNIKTEMEDSISAKLGNVLESDNDINTSDNAIKSINEAKKVYQKDRGKGGLINEKKELLNKLERELENSKSDNQTLEQKQYKLKSINEEIKELNKTREETSKKIAEKVEQGRKIAKQETYKTILTTYNQEKEKIDMLKEFFKNGIPADDEINKMNIKYLDIQKNIAEIESNKMLSTEMDNLLELEEMFDKKNITEELIDENIRDCYRLPEIEKQIQNKQIEKEKSKEKLKKNSVVTFTAGVILLAIGIILIIMSKMMGIAPITIGVICITIGFVAFHNNSNKNHKIDNEIKELNNSKQELENQITELLRTCNINSNDLIMALAGLKSDYKRYNELIQKKNQKDVYQRNCIVRRENLENEIKKELTKFFSKLDKPYIDLLQELKIKKNEYITETKEFEKIENEKKRFEEENNIEELTNIKDLSDVSEEELRTQLDNINNNLDKLNDEKNQLKNFIDIIENQIAENEYLETDIENLKNEINKMQEKYKILNKTEELLQTAKQDFSSSYLQEMIKGFSKYVNMINNKQLSTNVDINLNVKVDVNGSQKEIKYFSSGYKDLIYICMRFSLINALFKEEKPFVVLDDPFVNLDEAKTENALQVIDEIAKEYQIIYFVCNSSRTNTKF